MVDLGLRQHIISVAPLDGVSQPIMSTTADSIRMLDINAYYMYPQLYPASNFFVLNKKPFTVFHKDELTYESTKSLESGIKLLPFERKISAEQYRLFKLSKYYESIGNIQESIFWNERHNNINEEHPEWLI